jgi:Ca2+-binding RTX toxin-like protein
MHTRLRPATLLVAALIVVSPFVGGQPARAAVAMPAISVADVVVGEAAGTMSLAVTLSDAGVSTVTVKYGWFGQSANPNQPDFVGVGGTLTFAPGVKSQNVAVQITNDGISERLETFRVSLSLPTNAVIAKPHGIISIVDNDTAVPSPRLFIRDAVVDETAGTATVPVLLGGPAGGAFGSTVTVAYATANGSAVAGSDYAATSGTLSFAPGQTVKTIIVPITDDTALEGAERLSVNLSAPTGGATVLDGHGTVLIGPSDATALAQPALSVPDVVVSEGDGYVDVVISLSAPGQTPVVVTYGLFGQTANPNQPDFEGPGATIRFAAKETTRVARIHIPNDSASELLETFRVSLSLPAGATNAVIAKPHGIISIVDNDSGVTVYSYGISNDTYTVVAASDVIVENVGGGTDTVQTSLSYTLPAEIENVALLGASAVSGTGNAVANTLTGNGAANFLSGLAGNDSLSGGAGGDTLVGGSGSDTLTGGANADVIVFDSLSGLDKVTDFSSIDDTFRFRQGTVHIGDGDAIVEGGATRSAPGGFAKTAELVIFTTDIVGAITTTSAAATIGSATSAYAIGDDRLFVVDNGTSTGVLRFHSSAADASVSAPELQLLATVQYAAGTTSTAQSDYQFVP